MMVETDYIYVRSPVPEILRPMGQAVGFEYQYIAPRDDNMKRVYREYLADHPSESEPRKYALPRTGNAPSCLNVRDLRAVAPLWAEFVNRTEVPEERRKALGWLRDMYAYDLAAMVGGRRARRGGDAALAAADGAAASGRGAGERVSLALHVGAGDLRRARREAVGVR